MKKLFEIKTHEALLPFIAKFCNTNRFNYMIQFRLDEQIEISYRGDKQLIINDYTIKKNSIQIDDYEIKELKFKLKA